MTPKRRHTDAHDTFQSSFSPIWPFILYLYFEKILFVQQWIRLCIFVKIGEGHFWIWGGTHLGRVAHISSIIIVIIVSQKTRNGEHRDWWAGWGDIGTGEHRDWGTCLGGIGISIKLSSAKGTRSKTGPTHTCTHTRGVVPSLRTWTGWTGPSVALLSSCLWNFRAIR